METKSVLRHAISANRELAAEDRQMTIETKEVLNYRSAV